MSRNCATYTDGMKSLQDVVSAAMGRRVQVAEIAAAAEMSTATYHRRASGAGLHPDEVTRVAREFDLNPAVLLVDLGVLTAADVASAAGAMGLDGMSDSQILEELLGRAQQRERTGPEVVVIREAVDREDMERARAQEADRAFAEIAANESTLASTVPHSTSVGRVNRSQADLEAESDAAERAATEAERVNSQRRSGS